MEIIVPILMIFVFAGFLSLLAKLWEPICVILMLLWNVLIAILEFIWTVVCVAFYIITLPIHGGKG